jgi:RNA-binding protein
MSTGKRFKRRLIRKMSSEKPTIWIGRLGVTDALIEEVSKQLDVRKVVKLKVLKSALSERRVEDLADEVARRTNSRLIEIRGHTFVLYRKRTGISRAHRSQFTPA